MTWQQYQQLKELAQALIQRKLAELQPSGGEGVTVQGNRIGFDQPRSPEDVEEESWGLVLWGRAVGMSGMPFDTGWQMAGSVARSSLIFTSSYFWESTQMFTSEESSRSFTLHLEVETFAARAAMIYGQGLFRFPVRVLVETVREVYRQGPTGPILEGLEVVDTDQAVIRASGWSKDFKAPAEAEFYHLRPVSILHV